jgi:hypothetical protein
MAVLGSGIGSSHEISKSASFFRLNESKEADCVSSFSVVASRNNLKEVRAGISTVC